MQLGKSLALREDLYSWSFLSSYHPDHLALLVFLRNRETEIEKNERALKDA